MEDLVWLHNTTIDRLLENKNITWQHWIQQIGYKIRKLTNNNIPKYLGQGKLGVAYQIDTKVIKFFWGHEEFKALSANFLAQKNKNQLTKYDIKIFDLGKLNDDLYTYYIIVEKINKINLIPNLKLIPNRTHGDVLDHWLLEPIEFRIKHHPTYENLKSRLHGLTYYEKFETLENLFVELSSIRNDIWLEMQEMLSGKDYVHLLKWVNNKKLKSNWLDHLIIDMTIKYLTKRSDLHHHNTGIARGYIIFFDTCAFTSDLEHMAKMLEKQQKITIEITTKKELSK